MELHYTLTEEDLRTGLLAAHVARIQRWSLSWVAFALSAALACALAWPITTLLFERLLGRPIVVVVYLVAVLVAVPVISLRWRARRRRPPQLTKLTKLTNRSVQRQLAAALPRSVLGPIVLRVSDTGLWRKNDRDEVSIAPAEVVRLIRGPEALVVELRSRRILVVPIRAFDVSPGAEVFVEALARAVQQAPTMIRIAANST